MTAILTPLLASLGPWWAVALLVAVVFAETGLMVFVLPGDSLLFAAGLLVGAGRLSAPLVVVIGACTVAAVAGDQVGFRVGRRWGPQLAQHPSDTPVDPGDPGASLTHRLGRPLRWLWSPRHLEAARSFFDRHGPTAVVSARFVPLVRTFTPAVAGASGMPASRFGVYNVVGGLGWSAAMVVAGRLLGGVPLVAHHVELVTVGIVVASLAPAALGWTRRTRGGPPRSATATSIPTEPASLASSTAHPSRRATGDGGGPDW
ncbi:DedA family protein [Nocardioides sp. C4-1]|uniref:DedA family protein n=1 Tax=Nocardioides sp. C4-1 TaxID=3151851 RepID=UPI0032659BD9